MITNFKKFKLFESSDTAKHELTFDFLDNGYALEYYNNNYLNNYTENDIIEIIEVNPNSVSDVFDNDSYVKSFIDDEIQNYSFDNFDIYEYKKYIEVHLSTEKENKIIELYYDNNEEDDDIEKEEYNSDMLDDLDSDQLKEVIIDDDNESDFIEYTIRRRYEGMTFIDIRNEVEGIDTFSELISNIKAEKFYQYYGIYIDEDRLIELYKLNENDDAKYNWVESQIEDSIEIQHYFMDNFTDYNNITLLLFEIFENKSDHMNDISDEYDFQKRYIKEYMEENLDDDATEEEKVDCIAEALNDINSNFMLDSEIKKEFKQYMFIVDSDKFNV